MQQPIVERQAEKPAAEKSTKQNNVRSLGSEPDWYKDAIIYQLHIKSFYDANNDGIGDFKGLIEKLDYIATLGVNTVWLLPFYPSPLRDDGYDIADYYGVNPDYGTVEDVRLFIDEAHKRGLRVITELVINHTSDQHPWFQRARTAPPGSAERDYYVWSDDDKKYAGTRIIFVDTEKSNWAWDPEAQAYYWHRFYSHQPDLNFDNPEVLKAVLDVMNYWLAMGVDGLRLDAVPYLVEREGTNNENLPETHQVLKKIRAEVDAKFPDRLLLAEANQWPEDTQEYFGDGDECHMAFHFPLMPRMYMALAQEDRYPITDILRQTPQLPEACQWAIFLRNHDELTLEMVTDKERDYLWNQYASDRRARLNLGIRRRLAPLVQKDRRRIEVLHSLLLSMRGTPIIYYGDEICMGDNIFLGDRDGVRTPMQWSPDRNGGFSRADPAQLMLPTIMDPLYGYSAVNVEVQSRDPHSFLSWIRLMLGIRSQYKAFGRGSFKMLYPRNRHILAYLREWTPPEHSEGRSETILCLTNVSHSAQAVEVDLSLYAGQVPVEMSGGSQFPPIGELPYLLTLPPYGFYWFLLTTESDSPDWYTPPPERMPEYITLVLRSGIEDVTQGALRQLMESEILPAYLPHRRWFSGKDATLGQVRIAHCSLLPEGGSSNETVTQQPVLVVEVEAEVAGDMHRYQLPLTIFYEDQAVAALVHQLALARVRRKQRIGELTDAVTANTLGRGIVGLLAQGSEESPASYGELFFEPTARFEAIGFDLDTLEIRTLAVEQSNSSLVVGEKGMLKIFRRLFPNKHPEVEIGRVLTHGDFKNTAQLLGHVYRQDSSGDHYVLAVLQQYIPSQGNAWEWMQNHLTRFHLESNAQESMDLDSVEPDMATPDREQVLAELQRFSAAIGHRLGEMHQVLAACDHDPAFAPEVVGEQDCLRWSQSVTDQVERALDELARIKTTLNTADGDTVDTLLARRTDITRAVAVLSTSAMGSLMFRIHGDLHLGQILVAQDDAYFIDFEGEPVKSLRERSAKASPYRDVAGMLRSFHYAAEVASGHGAIIDSDEAHSHHLEFLREFRQRCATAFLDAYFTTAATLPHPWQHAKGGEALVDLFLLEKVAYEICYEAANRPHWVKVPLQGFFEIASDLVSNLAPNPGPGEE